MKRCRQGIECNSAVASVRRQLQWSRLEVEYPDRLPRGGNIDLKLVQNLCTRHRGQRSTNSPRTPARAAHQYVFVKVRTQTWPQLLPVAPRCTMQICYRLTETISNGSGGFKPQG